MPNPQISHCKSKQTNQSHSRHRLLIMTRYPVPGQTKTRLIPSLGAKSAALLHRELIRQLWEKLAPIIKSRKIEVEVHYSGGSVAEWRELLGTTPHFIPQNGHSLGERIAHATVNTFSNEATRVLILGTDCVDLDSAIIEQAFAALEKHDVVLGPASDGGYYLIGLNAPSISLFHGISWGTEFVLKQTLLKCRSHGLKVKQLVSLSDIDHPEDLLICRQDSSKFPRSLPQTTLGLLSIIIPTLNEEKHLAQTILSSRTNRNVELIVVDAGSQDKTVQIAHDLGARVLQTQPGRGRQLNAGAALARGETLLFLHADTLLPEDYFSEIWSLLYQGGIAGAFRLKIDSDLPGIRSVERGANFRSHYRQLPYGDQGVFLRATEFYQMRGFKNWPLLEDYEFCRRLRRRGQVLLSAAKIITSGRRWESLGVMKTTIINQLCLSAFLCGVSPDSIFRLYTRQSLNET